MLTLSYLFEKDLKEEINTLPDNGYEPRKATKDQIKKAQESFADDIVKSPDRWKFIYLLGHTKG